MSTLAAIPSVRFASTLAVAPSSAARHAQAAALVDTATRVANTASDLRLPPPSAPKTTRAVSAGARSFAESVSAFDVNHMSIGGLSNDSLTAAFLKLNISDPNENVETHDALYNAASNLRQAALDEEHKENDRVEELQKEATKYAETATKIGGFMKLANVVSIALKPFNACSAAVVGGAAGIGLSVMDAKQKAKDLAVREAQNEVNRTQVRVDEAQDMIQNEGDIVSNIMQTKNEVVNAVMKMIEQRGSTNQLLMSAAMAR